MLNHETNQPYEEGREANQSRIFLKENNNRLVQTERILGGDGLNYEQFGDSAAKFREPVNSNSVLGDDDQDTTKNDQELYNKSVAVLQRFST